MLKLPHGSWKPVDSVDVADPAEEPNARTLYNGLIADINFRPMSDADPVNIHQESSVYDLIVKGPTKIMDGRKQQLRWIHLPVNNMAWVEELMATLHREQTDENEEACTQEPDVDRLDVYLRAETWKDAFHGRDKTSIHSRFMMPLATRYSSLGTEDMDSDEPEAKWKGANVIAMYLPFLHWEYYHTWDARQRHIVEMKKLSAATKSCDCLKGVEEGDLDERERSERVLLHQHLYHDSPLHDRRTLDQSYFYNLRNVALRDADQIIGLHTKARAEKEATQRKMMMADQLWMWVIDGSTVVTAFPTTGTGHKADADVLDTIAERLPQAARQGTVKSLNSLVAFIVDHCTGVFHRHDIHTELAFFEFFADDIGNVKSEIERMFHDFYEVSQSIEQLYTSPDVSVERMSRELESLFSIKGEIKLMEKIEKIISDLDKIGFLCRQQEDTVQTLTRCTKTSRSLTDLLELIKTRRKSWSGMMILTREAQKSLQNLLDLKQRQAAVGEARSVRYQIEISAKQGRSIMLLTVFTIFFLPISVMAAIFGMNAKELSRDGQVSVGTISAIAFPTTLTLVVTALYLAFSEEFRACVVAGSKWLYSSWRFASSKVPTSV